EPDAGLGLRLAHLLAVEALEQVIDEEVLRPLTQLLLQLATGQDVEELVGAADLDVRLDRDRVVRLQQRVEEILYRDRRLLLEPLAEFLTLKHLLRREARREVDDVLQPEF